MNLDRREFLMRASGGLAALTVPGWRVFAQGAGAGVQARGDRAKAAAAALERARLRGRPLLVIVAPDDESARWRRGELFGIFLNRVEGEAAAELALCDLWCASPREFTGALAVDTSVTDATLAVLIETDGTGAKCVTGEPPPELEAWGDDWLDEEKRVESEKARGRFLAERLHGVIAPDLATLVRRAQAERDTLAARPTRSSATPSPTATLRTRATPRSSRRGRFGAPGSPRRRSRRGSRCSPPRRRAGGARLPLRARAGPARRAAAAIPST